jgi:hypothetical protein
MRNSLDGPSSPARQPNHVEHVGIAEEDTFLQLLADLDEQRTPVGGETRITSYQYWIERNIGASPALFAAWFNFGVELAGAGDNAGALGAYRNALTLRPDFYPAALNLGMLLEASGQPEAALATWQHALQPEETRIAILGLLAEVSPTQHQDVAKVLHVGCGTYAREKLPAFFRGTGWREIRLDIDPEVCPDFVASITDMNVITDGFVDAVYSSHNLEHLYPHEVPLALQQMYRVLKPDGFTLIQLPDLQEVARHIAAGKLEDPLYISPMGPIAPLDILYGHRPSMTSGNLFMSHRTGFTSDTLGAALIAAGFPVAVVQRTTAAFCLTAIAFRSSPVEEKLARVQAHLLPEPECSATLYTVAG